MQSKRADDYIQLLKTNDAIMRQQLEGLTDEDLLLQPESRGNCANWILGHIVVTRATSIMRTLALEPIWSDAERALYSMGSAAITGPECPHKSLAELMDVYARSGEQIIARLETITDDELDAQYNERSTVGAWVRFLVWHEAYHTGQFEYLRQLAGKDDQVPRPR